VAPACFCFRVTLEPHLKHSGAKTGRKIFCLVAVPREVARAAGAAPRASLPCKAGAQRLAGELAPVALRGVPCSPGEDQMAVSCQLYHPTADLLRARARRGA